ncbi:MAG: APC family permease [Halobacteriales archaeon]
MGKTLERDLGLYSTTTISVGAMIGSGIFVLPGLAFKIAGPAAIVAYLLAGVIALPAVLSKAEMATAMPEAGGTYLYIDRAMGPLLGTIAGLGAWFSLTFKSAFALVGLGAYLVLFSALSPKLVALVLAILLVGVNIIGVKQSGQLQSVIVTVVVGALLLFIADGLTFVDSTRYHPFLPEGQGSLLAATGFVFVSYAGVTKIASVAEEVENPGRNIPLAMLVSVLFMMLVYVFVVFVVVGVTRPEELSGSLRPMAVGAQEFLGAVGVPLISVVAAVALTSMANAGVLSASRFPFAMSRDELAPPAIDSINERFHTPVVALLITGAVLLLLIGFIPVLELAKLASAFKILVFSLVNVALIAFRESDLESYDPEFVAPGYPWVQLFGLLAGLVLLTQMGLLPLLGAVGIIVGGIAWYQVYGRERTEREGAALDALRGTTEGYSVRATEQLFATGGEGGTLIAVGEETAVETERTLVQFAKAVITRRGGRLTVAQFQEVPEQIPLAGATEEYTSADEAFERETSEITDQLNIPIEIDEVVSHDIEHSVANYVRDHDVNLVVAEWEPELFHGELFGSDVDWFMNHVSADILFVRDQGFDDIENVTVVGGRGPYSPLEVLVADAIGQAHDATVKFLQTVDPDVSSDQLTGIETYLTELQELCTADTAFDVVPTTAEESDMLEAAAGSDLVIASTAAHHRLYDVLFGTLPDRLISDLDCTVILAHTDQPRRHTFLRYLIERIAF